MTKMHHYLSPINVKMSASHPVPIFFFQGRRKRNKNLKRVVFKTCVFYY